MDALAGFENPGWDSSSLIPYMTATEKNIPPTDQQRADGANLDPSVHGFDGQVKVSFRTPMSAPGAQRLYKAAINTVFGIPASADLSKRDGRVSSSTSWSIFWDAAASINHRASAAYSYLYPSDQQRQGLTVLTEHIVGKVTFSGTKATGLQFGSPDTGNLFTVTANKEVLLASGTLGTPAILERSGVGAQALLSSLGIPQVVDLPGVGMNLQDQPGTSLSALVTNEAASNTSLIDGHSLFAPVIALSNIDDVFGSDATSVAQALQAGVSGRAAAAVAAGVQANIKGATQIFQRATDLITKSKQPIAEVIGESYPSVMTAIFWPLTPLSRGHIHINSSSPFARPVITPRFLTDDYDVQTSLHTAKKARSMYQTDAFKDIIQVVDVSGPKLNATDDEWITFLKDTSFGASHWLGTSAMMPRAWGGVVSPELKVYGTQKLRVIDASILPLQITAHTSPMAYAIAHKAADLILG
jgi:choline dehydrogenase